MDLEARIREIGGDLLSKAAAGRPHWWQAGWIDDRLMAWTMHDPRLRVQAFRFTDLLPALSDHHRLARQIHQHFAPITSLLPFPGPAMVRALEHPGILDRPAAAVVGIGARRLAGRFIAGATLPTLLAELARLRRQHLAFTVDRLGEAVLSETEADAYAASYRELIPALATGCAAWKADPLLDADPDGRAVPRVNVSIKLSALSRRCDPMDPHGFVGTVAGRLRPLLALARQHGVFVNIDMEHHQAKELVLDVVRQVLMEDAFRDWRDVGVAMQAYLRSVDADLETLAAFVRRRGAPLWVRLVKGAYADQERAWSAQRGWANPVWPSKAASDAAFERAAGWLIANRELLHPAFASHNARTIAAVAARVEAAGLPPGWLEIQALHGMAEPLRAAVASRGHRVRVYAPYGDLLGGMAYLVRRLLENTSNDGFVRALFLDRRAGSDLLVDPMTIPAPAAAPAGHAFLHEPMLDFADPAVRTAYDQALAGVAWDAPPEPVIYAGAAHTDGAVLEVRPPSHPSRILGRVHLANGATAHAAVAAARAAQPAWAALPAADRAGRIAAIGDAIARDRLAFAALIVHESGKNRREADADVCEAVDFCRFYAQRMRELAAERNRDVIGETNRLIHEARGVVAVIAPWNFPLAILCGMTVAGLVTGNAVVVKPAEQTPLVAARLHRLAAPLLPPGVLAFLPGLGEEAGAALVADPDVDVIAFTGSRQVGELIVRAAATPGPRGFKHVVCELGGKNAIIVTSDADLDEAVAGTVASAFGFQGQKCSACSRVIVEDSVHDEFVRRLLAMVRSLRLGPSEDPGADIGPVIDREARDRLVAAIARARSGATLAYPAAGDDATLPAEGWFVRPHVFVGVDPASELAQEELFGPVLAVLRARDLDHALALANGTRYALTGGAYVRAPAALARIRREFRVGNLYLNRNITGALVDRQPFGGFAMSGLGTKAGGDDYLLQFTVARAVTENIIRHGLTEA